MKLFPFLSVLFIIHMRIVNTKCISKEKAVGHMSISLLKF